jgi:hypothetical protein
MSATTTRKRGNHAANQASDVASSLTDSAKKQVFEVRDVAKDAVVSGTWAYPLLVSQKASHFQNSEADIQGYLLPRLSYANLLLLLRAPILTDPDPSLVKPLVPTILRGILISLAIVAGMFFFTYLPQVAVLAFISGPLGMRALLRVGTESNADFQPSSRLYP